MSSTLIKVSRTNIPLMNNLRRPAPTHARHNNKQPLFLFLSYVAAGTSWIPNVGFAFAIAALVAAAIRINISLIVARRIPTGVEARVFGKGILIALATAVFNFWLSSEFMKW